jgi:hypothetical protein
MLRSEMHQSFSMRQLATCFNDVPAHGSSLKNGGSGNIDKAERYATKAVFQIVSLPVLARTLEGGLRQNLLRTAKDIPRKDGSGSSTRAIAVAPGAVHNQARQHVTADSRRGGISVRPKRNVADKTFDRS